MDTYNQDMPTVPPPSRVPRTDPVELARREKVAKRTTTRSRIAELVAVLTTLAALGAEYFRSARGQVPPLRQCATADEVTAIVKAVAKP